MLCHNHNRNRRHLTTTTMWVIECNENTNRIWKQNNYRRQNRKAKPIQVMQQITICIGTVVSVVSTKSTIIYYLQLQPKALKYVESVPEIRLQSFLTRKHLLTKRKIQQESQLTLKLPLCCIYVIDNFISIANSNRWWMQFTSDQKGITFSLLLCRVNPGGIKQNI